jgi:hypothetical protein
MKRIFRAKLLKITEEKEYFGWRKGPDGTAEYDERFLGWSILLEGSRERLYIGRDEPTDLKIGCMMKVTVEVDSK